MNFRATSFSIASRAIRFSQRHNANIVKYQEQISSGQRLQKSSDDPIAFRQVTSLTSRRIELAADTQSLNNAKSILNTSVVQIQEYNEILTRAKVLTQQGIQSVDSGERNALALEVDGLLTRLKRISETRFDDAYLFSGTRSSVPPFLFQDPAVTGGTLQADYQGSDRNSRAFVGESVSVDTYFSGTLLFSVTQRADTIVLGNHQVTAGTGTDTLIGRTQLSITHELTTFQGGSGLAAGSLSAVGDTIIGPPGAHTVNIVDTSGNGSAGTISLNGGDTINFTNADSNLKVTGPGGEVIFVDTTAVTAGFSGVVDIEATGNLSVDGGVSTTPITFGSNQVVSDSASGRFATLNTQEIRNTGDASLEFPGTSNAFQLLYELSHDLRNSRDLSNSEYSEALERRLGEIENYSDHTLDMLGVQSTSLLTLERLGTRIEDLDLSVESQLIDIQATNIPEAVLRMENSSNLLQYTYAVTAQINSLGILDFLR